MGIVFLSGILLNPCFLLPCRIIFSDCNALIKLKAEASLGKMRIRPLRCLAIQGELAEFCIRRAQIIVQGKGKTPLEGGAFGRALREVLVTRLCLRGVAMPHTIKQPCTTATNRQKGEQGKGRAVVPYPNHQPRQCGAAKLQGTEQGRSQPRLFALILQSHRRGIRGDKAHAGDKNK